MNILLDTNIIISALCFPFSKPRKAFDLAIKNGNLLTSEDTFNELNTVLLKQKFDTYIELSLRQEFLKQYSKLCKTVQISQKIDICRDKKDNKFLELAMNGNADYIITGDSDLLILNPFENIKIITPDAFLNTFNKN